MKILVFMSDNRDLEKSISDAKYNSLAAVINNNYCIKHNYDFIYYVPHLNDENNIYNCIDPESGETRHASWSKLLSTINALNSEYDYIIYIDSDCIFKNFNKSLESLISLTDKPLIFLNNKPWNFDKPCAGFYILKVCDITKNIINYWFNYSDNYYNKNHSWEQHSLQSFYNFFTDYIYLIDEWMFKEQDGQFLRHIGSHEDKLYNNRTSYFNKFILDNDIIYSTSEIKTIKFNTFNFWKNKNPPTFNVLIATVGRPELQNMINSLKDNLSTDDCLTIVYDGHSTVPKFDLSGLKCKILEYCEPTRLKYWGHGIRNKYSTILEKRTFILHADDDNIYYKNTFDYLRRVCSQPETLYILQCMWGFSNVIPTNNKIIEGNVDTACGVIPYDLNKKGIWLPRVGGDGSFYEQIIYLSKLSFFIPKIIYRMRPHLYENTAEPTAEPTVQNVKRNILKVLNIIK